MKGGSKMDGIFVRGQRPKSKKHVKEEVAADPSQVEIEGTSMFGGYSGLVTEAPPKTYNFVGPDPHTSRKFYGNLTIKETNGQREYKVT
jgi:hypothetical protein